ncbi:MAG: EthD domain-containing protein, partial [Porticoccaceae bacterium]
ASHSVMIPEVVHLPCWELRAWDNGLEKPTVKLMAFFHPADGMSRRESQYYWTNKHIEVGSKLNDPIRYAPRYVQNHVLPEYHATNPAYDFAGCPELWFYSTEAARKLFSETDPVNQDKLVADEVKFSNRQKTLPFVTDEVLVYERKPESNC